jgi:RNA polymerase sigma-70 factor, ECF subfamily
MPGERVLTMGRSEGAELDFDQFYLAARDRLVAQIAALTGDAAEAQDHVQEGFARAWGKWARVSQYDDPEAWVRRAAYHRAVSRWRRARRHLLSAEVGEDAPHFDHDQLPVIEALRKLPASERRALILQALAGMTIAEIAAELSAPPGTVKSWLSRGRARLAGELDAKLTEVSQ